MTTSPARVKIRLYRLSHIVGVIALGIVILVSLGCSKKELATTTTQQPSSASTSEASNSGWKLDLKVTPDHPRMVHPATFAPHFVDNAGKPVENAQVSGSRSP